MEETKHNLHSLIMVALFADAASSYISLYHQVGFTSSEIIHSKLVFEMETSGIGLSITQYNNDNGVYTAKDFTLELGKSNQTQRLSGVGAHHQN